MELIIDEKGWIPDTLVPADRRIYFKSNYGEMELREQVRLAGSYWNPDKKAWHLEYRKVIEPGLEQRVVDPDIPL